MSSKPFDLAILGMGVAAVSTAALFIREAEAPALVIAAYRLSLASLPLMLISAAGRQSPVVAGAGGTRLTLLAGCCLALHFAFWIASVQQTSVITSVVLVTAQPLFVAIAGDRLLGERLGGTTWAGIGVATLGALVMIAADFGTGDSLRGDLYAILGAVFAAAYFLIGRRLRTQGTGWLPYATLVYATSAVVLVMLAAGGGESFGGYSLRTYGFFVALALVPQLIGHTALNRSLGYLPAVAVTTAVLGEPVGATILAAVFLDEIPTAQELLGGALVLCGVYLGLMGSIRREVATGPSLD